MNKNTDLGLLILRIAVGGLMLLHGIAKLNGVSNIEGMLIATGLRHFQLMACTSQKLLHPFNSYWV